MLGRIIEWSARNVFLVLLATAVRQVGAGIYAVLKTPLDALPDLSDVQVIIYTEYPGQAPQVVEDQVTYPLTTAMLSVPQVQGGARLFVLRRLVRLRDLRGRHRHLLGALAGAGIPEFRRRAAAARRDAAAGAGRDRRRLGLSVRGARREPQRSPSCAPSRTGIVRYQLTKAQGVAEVASIGGFVQQYQVIVDPRRAAGLRHSAGQGHAGDPRQQPRRRRARRRDGRDRVHGARHAAICAARADIEQLVVKAEQGTPVLLRDVARVELGPDERRGLTELNGEGEVVSGIAMARYGQNALEVIDNLKAKIAEIAARPARGRDDRGRLRPLRPDPSRDRHPQAHAARGKRSSSRWCACCSCCTCAARWWRS